MLLGNVPTHTVDGIGSCVCLQLLMKHPKERLELHNVLQHPWIIGNADPSVL